MIHSILMSTNFGLFFFSALSLMMLTRTQTSPQRTTVVEGNHFYSNYQINTTYNIAQVSVERPIIFILRKKDEHQVFDNNITVNLISGQRSVQCKFVSFYGMCFLQKLATSNMTMKLRCDHLPCEASWTIMQPSLKKVQSNQNIEEMYDISQSANHMIAMVSCNNPQITNFNQLVQTFSESEYVRGYTQNIIYLLFKKQQSGHLFFKIDPKAKACAQMAVYNIKQQMTPDQQLKDFVFANQSSIYTFGTRPKGQFRIDCAYHQMTKQAIKSQLILKITGQRNGMRENIVQITVKPPIATNNYEFSMAIPNIPDQYGSLQVDARSSNNILIFNYFLALSERVEIEETEHSHFVLKKGNILKFKLTSQPDAEKSDQVFFFINKPNQVKMSQKQCSKKQGCDFQVQALSDGEFILYAGKNSGGDVKGQINFIDFKNRITKKVRDEQNIFLRTPVKKDQVIKVLVNNPNVIIRAASSQKCQIPSSDCYEHIANSHHHFIYEPKNDGNLLMSVLGLDSCQFTVTVIQSGSGSLQLKDGQPFLYLMDDRQSRIYFKFILQEKIGVSFNLIAPLNDLLLVVNNGKQKPDGEEHTASTDGYISFTKSELQSNDFSIMVQKTADAKLKSVHFTLIATTSGANLRLDPGIAHTESLKPKQYKDFVFQFDKKGDYIINFYTPNIDKQDIDIKMMVNNEDKWTDNKVQHLSISQNSDVLNLKDISEQLCIQSGDLQCQIFLRIVNAMKIQLDITVTLLVKDSVIQLKDGLWQTYAINTIAKTSHFYFLPKTKNSSVSIMYKSSLVDVGISYTLWKSDKENIDPTQWPFPAYKEDVEDKFSFYKAVNHIIIDRENLKGCWPSCLILISLYKKKSSTPNLFQMLDPNIQGNFSILAANKMFEIPERSKMQIMLRQDEEKYLMVDLKYTLQKEALTFFTNSILGSFSLYGNVYSQKNPRCPTESDHDFNFGEIQTQIKISSVETKRQQNDMSQDQDIFLCILAKGYLESKFTIQFTSEQQIIKLLHFDSFERFQLQSKQVKYFQLEAQQDYQIKFTRQKGFFYVKITVCDNSENKDYQECLEQLKNQKDKGKQIITKTEQFSEKPCSKCIVFIRVQSDDYCEAMIHVQSKYSIVQLKEGDLISDFTNEGQVNRYSITSVQKQETIISIEVTEGEPVVTVTNYGDLSITKQKNPSTSNILIVIPPQKTPENTVTPLGGVNYDAFTYSYTFRYFHVQIKSKNPKLSTAYTISYSSGERQTYMEDGMAVGYTLQPNKKTYFLYKNPSQTSHGYLSMSMAKSSSLFNLKFKIYTFSDPNDEDTKVEVTPQKPPMRKHTPNPTIVYSLPVGKLIRMQLESESQEKVTLMINHQELIILPFDQQFPFELHKNESINLITDVNNPGYLLVSIRKCDQSSPEFGYTFDYDSFQKNEFQYTTSLSDDPRFQFYIKASKIGTLYMQMNVTDQFGLFSIKIRYSEAKIKSQRAKAGKNGVVQYKIVQSDKAEVSFNGIVCSSNSKCDKDVKYYYMSSNNLQDVYTQTVCPYSYFQVLGITSSQPIKINQITSKPDGNGVITFNYTYSEHVSYLSIKAISGDEEVYYQPIEVITLWGSMARAGKTNKILIGIGLVLVCLCSLIMIRRSSKKGYSELKEVRDSFDYQ